MSDTKASPPRASASRNDQGVLANLPRTRPQRSSPRRAAARKTAAAKAPAGTPPTDRRRPSEPGRRKPTTGRTPAGKRTRSTAKPARPSALGRDASPRQGFESDGETMTGTVLPPGGAELVASAAELVGELAKASISSGERLLKDVFSRLRPS
jgi:hypothetical protein